MSFSKKLGLTLHPQRIYHYFPKFSNKQPGSNSVYPDQHYLPVNVHPLESFPNNECNFDSFRVIAVIFLVFRKFLTVCLFSGFCLKKKTGMVFFLEHFICNHL